MLKHLEALRCSVHLGEISFRNCFSVFFMPFGWDGCAPPGGRSLAGCQHRFAECAALRLRRRSPQMVFPVCHRLNLFVRRVVAFSDCQDLLLPVCLSAPSLFRVSSDPVLRYSYRSLFSTCAVFSHIYPNLIYPEHQILSCERAKDSGFGADTLCRADSFLLSGYK